MGVSEPDRMRLSHLAMRDFRNLAAAELTVPPEGVVVVGDNGHGKTNLLEAIYYLVLFRSFRGSPDRDLVAFGADGFHLEAVVQDGVAATRQVAAGFDARMGRKRITVDGAEAKRVSGAIGALRAVALSPADQALVAGPPAARRRFLDVILSLTEPHYLEALKTYRHALRQRNAALRGRRTAVARAFEPALRESGTVVTAARRSWVDRHRARFAEVAAMLGENGVAEVRYRGADSPVDYAALRTRDVARGATGEGPHRDDLEVTLDGRALSSFGSSGQQRTAATALKVLEAEATSEPVLLLDDAFAELDPERRERLAALCAERQYVLTVPSDLEVPLGARELPRWRIVRGRLAA